MLVVSTVGTAVGLVGPSRYGIGTEVSIGVGAEMGANMGTEGYCQY